MIKLADEALLKALLPQSIAGDPRMRAAADVLSPLLRSTALAIPNLLIFGRMGNQLPEDMIASLGRLTTARGGLAKPSTALLEQLAWQFHVDFREVARTDEQLAGMVLQSIPWHRIKGTPASIRAALALFGLAAEIEEDGVDDYWATYQLGLPQIADIETVKLVCRVAYEMQPARCSLYRIYTDVWDVRPGSYGDGRYSVAAYSYYSGVPVPGLPNGDDLLVSFGRLFSAQSMPELAVLYFGRLRARGAEARVEDDMLYGIARYSVTLSRFNPGFLRSRLRSIVFGRPIYRRHIWTGLWDERMWQEIIDIKNIREPFSFVHHSFARIEGVYGESFYGDLNTFYGQPVYVLIDDPPIYGESLYSEHDPQRRVLVVDEMFSRDRGVHVDGRLSAGEALYAELSRNRGVHVDGKLSTGEALYAELSRDRGVHADGRLLADDAEGLVHLTRGAGRQAETSPFFPLPAQWTDDWDQRTWMDGMAYANLTHEEII
jgi:hypothetical protein